MSNGNREGRRSRRSAVSWPEQSDARDESSERSWFDDDDGLADRPPDYGTELVSLRFISGAVRRSRRLWAGLAVLGLLLGIAYWKTHPATPEASTTLLLTVGPESQSGAAIVNERELADSRGVAAIALRKLGLPLSIDSFLATYKATVVTDRVLRISVSAPSSSEAVTRANAVASAFLQFRASQLWEQQKLQFAALDNVLAVRQKSIDSIDKHVAQLSAQPRSDSQQAQLKQLRATRDQAKSDLAVLDSQVKIDKATADETTAAMVGQSAVLDPASPLPHSRLKPLVLFAGAGLIAGLVFGVGLVVIRALVSDRVRRRDDVALALGAPVQLSLPDKPPRPWRPGRRGLAGAKRRDVQRVEALLLSVLRTRSRKAALAVVPVDDTRVAAMSVVSLAVSLARQDKSVVVADLCSGAPAAKLVGAKNPGLHAVQLEGALLSVAIPDPQEIAPVGPLGGTSPHAGAEPASELAAACSTFDVVLTVATLDPSLASDHLQTWALDAVVMVTAGRSSWTRIHAVGELIRLSGTRIACAVLLGADKSDESLGVTVASRDVSDRTPIAENGITEPTPTDRPIVPRFMSR